MSWWEDITGFVDKIDLGGVGDFFGGVGDFVGGLFGGSSPVPTITSNLDELDLFDLGKGLFTNTGVDTDYFGNIISGGADYLSSVDDYAAMLNKDVGMGDSGFLSGLLGTNIDFSKGIPLTRELLRGGLQERQFDRYLEELKKRDKPYQDYGQRLEQIYDPARIARETAREKSRRMKELQPSIDQAGFKRLYGQRKRGMPMSKVETQKYNQALADLYSTLGRDATESVLAGLDREAQLAGKQFGLLTEMPSAKLDVAYSSYNPYEAALSRLLRG